MKFSKKNEYIISELGNMSRYIKKFLKINNYILLGLLILLNIIIRLPTTPHELGVDTFYIQALSTSISTFGKAKWIIHPASFFGLYPYSYPSAQPFILSGISQSLGISLEYTILLLSISLGILGLLSSYMLAEIFFDNKKYSILTAYLYSMGPNFVVLTNWQASSRGIFLAILPLIIWLFLRQEKKVEPKYILLLLMLLIFSFATHRITIFLTITIFVYVTTYFIKYISTKIKYIPENTNLHVMYITLFLSVSLFAIQFTELGLFDLNDYHSGFYHTGTDFVTVSLNMLIDYVGKLGIILLFSAIGFVKLAYKKNKKFAEIFVLINFIALLPFMGLEVYSPLVMSPFLLILAVVGISTLIHNYRTNTKWKKGIIFFGSAFLILSTWFTIFMLNHWNIDQYTIDDATVTSADFLRDKSNGTIIANSGDLSSKITAFTKLPTLPLGGPYVVPDPPNQIAYGFVNLDEIIIEPLNYSEIRPTSESLYSIKSTQNAKEDWTTIMENNYWDENSKNILLKYNAQLLIEVDNNQMYNYWSWRHSNMLTSLKDSGNKIYSDNKNNIYSFS